MMLRVSSQTTDREFGYDAIAAGNEATPSGVPHGEAMIAFTDAVVQRDQQRMADLRRALRREMGDAAFVDVSGVIANFHRMTRIADGTGISLDQRMMALTEDLRADLGLNDYRSAKSTLGRSDEGPSGA